MESTRQSKVAKQIQKDISDIFTKEAADLVRGVMVTVTSVRMSPDLGYAKIMNGINAGEWRIRKALWTRIRNQLKSVPELSFFLDDSLEYIENIDNLLK